MQNQGRLFDTLDLFSMDSCKLLLGNELRHKRLFLAINCYGLWPGKTSKAIAKMTRTCLKMRLLASHKCNRWQ